MRRRSTLPVVLLLALGAVSACGDDTKDAKAGPSASASASSSDVDSASPSTPSESDAPSAGDTGSSGASGFPHDRTEATSLHKAVLAESAASTPEEKAAVDAWMAFWQGAADTYYFYKPTQTFTSVASGTAKSAILDNMENLKADKRRVVGWARDNVTAVKVTGDTAKIRDCTENYTFTVDQEAEPVTRPPLWYDARGTLKKVDGRWMVTMQNSRELKKSCLS
jgi:hypothetical protein